MSKIHYNQIINYLLMEEKKWKLKVFKIQSHSFIVHEKLMTLIKIWKIIVQQKRKVLIMFDNMIAYMGSNKKLNLPIVTELL